MQQAGSPACTSWIPATARSSAGKCTSATARQSSLSSCVRQIASIFVIIKSASGLTNEPGQHEILHSHSQMADRFHRSSRRHPMMSIPALVDKRRTSARHRWSPLPSSLNPIQYLSRSGATRTELRRACPASEPVSIAIFFSGMAQAVRSRSRSVRSPSLNHAFWRAGSR